MLIVLIVLYTICSIFKNLLYHCKEFYQFLLSLSLKSPHGELPKKFVLYCIKKNYLLPNITYNHPKIYKTPQNTELCNEHRVSGLLKM